MGSFTNLKRFSKKARMEARRSYNNLSYAERDEIGLTESQYCYYYLIWMETVTPLRIILEEINYKKMYEKDNPTRCCVSSSGMRF